MSSTAAAQVVCVDSNFTEPSIPAETKVQEPPKSNFACNVTVQSNSSSRIE